MRRYFFIALLLSAAYATPAFAATKAPPAMEVGGWIPFWRTATGTADVLPHLSQLTEVSPFVYTVRPDGTVYDAGGMQEEPWTSFVASAKAAKVRVIPTVMWANRVAIQAVLSHAKTRIALEESIASLVKDNGYAGIDIDFEGKEAETKNYFSTFLRGLYTRLGNKWLYCSIEPRTPLADRYSGTPPADATVYANDYTQINRYCDRVELMTYDQGEADVTLDAARAAPYVPVSDPAWVASVVQLAEKQINPRKILIGVPTYGYEYSVTPLTVSGYQYDLQWAFDPRYATQLASQLGITPVRNASGELSFIYKVASSTATAVSTQDVADASQTNNTLLGPGAALYSQAAIAGGIQPPFNIVWWSDAQAISDKIALARQLGVRGIAIFKLDGGEDPNIWNVLPKALHSGS